MHTHTCLFFYMFFSVTVYYRFPMLSSKTVLSILYILIIVCICESATPILSVLYHPSPLATTILFSVSVSLFLFCR